MKEPTHDIRDWQNAVESGLRYRKDYGKDQRWETYKSFYRNDFASQTLPINITHSHARTIIPTVYFRNPNIIITSHKGNFMHARLIESTDNWLLQEMDVKPTIKTMLLDAFLCGKGIGKIGYDSQYGYDPKLQVTFPLDSTLSSFGKKGERLEYNINIKPGMPWFERCSPNTIIVPFGSRTLTELPWIDHVSLRPLRDVLADPKYKNLKDLQGSHMELLFKGREKENFYTELRRSDEWVEIHEIRDARRGEIMTFVPNYDKWLREPQPDHLQIEGLPFEAIGFDEDPDYFWEIPEAGLIYPQQLEMNETRRQAQLHRRIALLKFLVDKDKINDIEIEKMLKEGGIPVCKVEGDPRTAVQAVQPHVPPDLATWVELIRKDVRELLGYSRNEMGEFEGGSRRTATEAGIVHTGAQIRISEKQDALADMLVRMIRKVNQVIFSLWSTPHVVQLVGMDGAVHWVQYQKEDIVGEYSLKVDVESMSPVTTALQRKEIIEVLTAIGKHPNVNVDYFLRLLLRQYPWLDVMQALPQAPEGQMTTQEFMSHQERLKSHPQELQERVQRNLNVAQGM